MLSFGTANRMLRSAAIAALFCIPALAARAAPLTTVYSFTGQDDGHFPGSGLVLAKDGDFYGVAGGGLNNAGVVYRLTADGSEDVVHNFAGPDGSVPAGELSRGPESLLYGTTRFGGANNAGTVFTMNRSGVVRVLYSFPGGRGGSNPHGRLAVDTSGTAYGMADGGGVDGYGLIFKVTAQGKGTVLKQFLGHNGAYPYTSGLTPGKDGNLYGTTGQGGRYGGGVVFRITPDGDETVLHSFQCCGGDGEGPTGGVIIDASGNLYGTLSGGGENNAGAVFRLTPQGKLDRLFSLGGKFGSQPSNRLVMDAAGNLFGTASGSSTGCKCGTLFEVRRTGKGVLLHTFQGAPDGSSPVGDLLLDGDGDIYGVTYYGGDSDAGMVYRLPR